MMFGVVDLGPVRDYYIALGSLHRFTDLLGPLYSRLLDVGEFSPDAVAQCTAHALEVVLSEAIKGSLEIVQYDRISQALEHKSKLPKRIDAVW